MCVCEGVWEQKHQDSLSGRKKKENAFLLFFPLFAQCCMLTSWRVDRFSSMVNSSCRALRLYVRSASDVLTYPSLILAQADDDDFWPEWGQGHLAVGLISSAPHTENYYSWGWLCKLGHGEVEAKRANVRRQCLTAVQTESSKRNNYCRCHKHLAPC